MIASRRCPGWRAGARRSPHRRGHDGRCGRSWWPGGRRRARPRTRQCHTWSSEPTRPPLRKASGTGVDSPDDRRPAPLRRHRPYPRRRRCTTHREWYEEIVGARLHRRVVGEAEQSPTASRRWRSPPRGHRRCAAASPSRPCSRAARRCSRSPRRRSPMPRPGGSRSGSGRRRRRSSNVGTAIPFEQRSGARATRCASSRRALAGEKVTERYDTFEVQGFRLGLVPEEPPPSWSRRCARACCGSPATEADGAIVNWLSAEDVARVAPFVGDKEIVARIFVAPTRRLRPRSAP